MAREPLEAQRPVRRWRVEGLQQVGHRRAVVDGVVDVGALPRAHQGVLEVLLRLGVVGQRQLVVLLLVAVVEGDEVEVEAGLGPDAAEAAEAGHLELAALAAEPAGLLDELLDGVVDAHAGASSVAGRVNRNQ